MDAAVHSHRPDRAVEMRGVPGENDAALAERGGDALVHHIGVMEDDLVGFRSRVKALKLALTRFQDSFRRPAPRRG